MGTATPRRLRSLTHLAFIAVILFSGTLAVFPDFPSASAAVGDQQRIVYLDRNNNVWTARTDGSESRQLTSQGGFGEVQISSDGTRIIATGPYDGGTGVYLMSTDDSIGLRSIATGNLPAWSPDNSKFAFHQSGVVHIFDRDGGFVASAETGAHLLEWSPDGTRLAFARNIVDPYGSGCPIRQLGWFDLNTGSLQNAGSLIGNIAWNPDGTGIIHVSAGDGAIRSRSVTSNSYTQISSTPVNACGAPFFTTNDGRYLIGMRWYGEPGAELLAFDLRNGNRRSFADVPVNFPASSLPSAYVTGDESGRYVYLVRSYPTDIHRLDLETGQRLPLLTNDWRQVVSIAPDGSYFGLLDTPSGKAKEMTIRHVDGGSRMIEDVGWINWAPSLLNQSAALAWLETWSREDRPVAAGVSRTWLWGPNYFDRRIEPYDEAPGGYRAVSYYDKSRMEITNESGNRNDDWYVTNGLLVRELITGAMQVGDSRFVDREPAQVPVAGDENDPNSPTYATLQGVLDAPPVETGQEITATITRDGQIGNDGPGGVTAAHFVAESNHTVASVFWDYLNSTGPIWDGQQITDGQLFSPTFFATGYPITEAYWATVRVAGEEREVLMQCFERRCLTYTPDNPEGWQVEMGNVGRHYHAWRYSE